MQTNVERRQQIIELRNQGKTRIQIAAQLGISKDLVGAYLHGLLKAGLIEPLSKQESKNRNMRRVTQKVDVREARQMRLDGKSFAEIAKHCGVSTYTLKKVIGQSKRITPLQQQLIELRLQGKTYKEIADHLGRPEGTVAVILSRLVKKGLLPSGQGGRAATGKVDVEEARQLRSEGKSLEEIAKRFDVSAQTIANVIEHQPRGSKVDVKEARRLRSNGQSFAEIAKRFDVSAPTIAKLIEHQPRGKR